MGKQLHSIFVAAVTSLLGFLISSIVTTVHHGTNTLGQEFGGGLMPWVPIAMVTSFGLAAPACGVIATVQGARLVSLAGGVVVTLGMLITAFARSEIHVFITHGIIMGIGCSLVYIGIYESVKTEFTRNRNIVYGILGCISVLGHFTHPLIQNMIDVYHWRGTLLILTGILMNIIPLSCLLPGASYRSDVPETSPAQEGLINDMNKRLTVRTALAKRPNGIRLSARRDSEDLETLWNQKTDERHVFAKGFRILAVMKIWRKTGFYGLLFAAILYGYGVSVIRGHIQQYVHERSFAVSAGSETLLIVFGVSVCVLTLLQGVVTNYFLDPVYWYVILATVGGLLTFVFIIPLPLSIIFVYTALLGMSFAGTGREITASIIINLAGEDNFAFPFGICVFVSTIAMSLGTPSTAWVLKKAHSYKPVFAIAAVAMAMAAIIIFLLQKKLKRTSLQLERSRSRAFSDDDSGVVLVTSL
ncbi:monocarboxylate transporter 9-like [Haliotis rubra]|uniref:monocarboxylate transporter 9-like n=1 Tax=Haliotis rubra TaxID=36100 RepID=UPI001EE5D539|nr:monocarboxylate transporter 9-like [Haliotis rubra]